MAVNILLWPSRVWDRVDWQAVTKVLEETAAHFFGAEINSEAVGYSEIFGISYENTRWVTSENYNLKNAEFWFLWMLWLPEILKPVALHGS